MTTTLNGREVAVAQNTDYPFRDTIAFSIKLRQAAPFTLSLRIPAWCDDARISVDGKEANVACAPGSFARLKRVFRDGDTIELRLPMRVRTIDWFNGRAASIERGPLVYALMVEERREVLPQDTPFIQGLLRGNTIKGYPALEFYPAGEWRYGIEASIRVRSASFSVIEAPMSDNPFVRDASPVRIEVPVRALPGWQPGWRPEPDPRLATPRRRRRIRRRCRCRRTWSRARPGSARSCPTAPLTCA